jgi:hypothetical protein
MVHKEKKIKFLILISKYRYRSKIDLDYYYSITDSLKYCNYKYLSVEFNKNNKIINLKKIISFLRKKNIIILAEANIEYNYLYSNTLIDLITKSKHPIISFFGDLDQHQIKSKFVNISKAIFFFDKYYVDWANKNIKKNMFHYIYSFPIVKYSKYSFLNFNKRYYDISYLGSKKSFRVSFIYNFLKCYKKKYLTFFRFLNFKTSLFNKYSSYLNILLKSKFYFCTRAGLYENNPFNKFNYNQGRYAGRISEAIAAGCIPVYWQPKKPNNFLDKFILKNRFHRFKYLNSFFMGDKNSRPYDVFDENFKDMMLIVDSPQDLNDQISKLTKNQIKKKLQLLNTFYYKYIHPKVFFKKIFSLV